MISLAKVTAPLTVKLDNVPPVVLKVPPADVRAPVPKALLFPAIKLDPDAKVVPPL